MHPQGSGEVSQGREEQGFPEADLHVGFRPQTHRELQEVMRTTCRVACTPPGAEVARVSTRTEVSGISSKVPSIMAQGQLSGTLAPPAEKRPWGREGMRHRPRDPDGKAEGYGRGPTASAPCFSPLLEPAQSKPRWTRSILLETLNAKVLGSTAE